jgi:hypothetical protein
MTVPDPPRSPDRAAGAANSRIWPTGPGAFWDPDPVVCLANWRAIARRHITHDMCVRLERHGFHEAAAGLRRHIGDES